MSEAKPKTLADRIISASVVVGLAHLCLKFAGLIQSKFAAQYLDSMTYDTIMVVAFTGVINTLFLVSEEVIGPSFLTLFMRERDEKNEKAAWDFANLTLTFQTIVLLFLVLSVAVWPDFYIRLFTEWTPETHPEQYHLLRIGLRILAPSLYFLSIGSTTYIILNGYKKFFLAAFGDASTKICIIIALVTGIILQKFMAFPIYYALFAGILIGSVGKVATHLAGMLHQLKLLRPNFSWNNPAFKAMLVLMIPLLLGIIFAKVRDNFNNIYCLSRLNEAGLMKANDLGRKLFASIQWLVPFTLQIALFPFLCELVNKNDRVALGKVLGTSCRLLLSFFVPGSILLAVLGIPLTILIYWGGHTDVSQAYWAGISTSCYCLVLPAAAAECVLMQGFFADQKTMAVTVIGILSSVISVIFSYIFIVKLNVPARQALIVVALGFVISRFVKSVALAIYLGRSTPMFRLGETMVFLLKLVVLALLVGGAAYGVSLAMQHILPDGVAATIANTNPDLEIASSRLRLALRIMVSGGAGAIVFVAGALLLRLQETQQMFQWILEKALPKRFRKTKATA